MFVINDVFHLTKFVHLQYHENIDVDVFVVLNVIFFVLMVEEV